MRRKNYDFIVVGAGPAGVFFSYEMLRQKEKEGVAVKILLIEQGVRVEERESQCPKIVTGICAKCKKCIKTVGFSGAGAFSDGKLSLYNEEDDDIYVGGNLHDYIGVNNTKRLIDYTDKIYLEFGATTKLEGISYPEEVAKLKSKSKENDISLVSIPIRHLGTEDAPILYKEMERYLERNGVEILFKTEVNDFIINNNKVEGVTYKNATGNYEAYAPIVVSAVGRVGADWMLKMCNVHNIKSVSGPVDIGIRYELSDAIMYDVNEYLYEGKFFATPIDKVRTFCQNPGGFVTEEGYDGKLMLANGHSYKDPNRSSGNTNLALLATIEVSGMDSLKYARNIAKLANDMAGGGIIIQRYGDLKDKRATWKEDLGRNSVIPTLKSAVAGDLSLVLPGRIIDNIILFIEHMDKVIPGFADEDNLCYGVEAKFYSNKVKLSKTFETSVEGLYAIGDGCGLTRGLMMASASGVQLAWNLCKYK